LLGSATFDALAGFVIGGGAGLFRKDWRRQLRGLLRRHRPEPGKYSERLKTGDGYRVADRLFSNEKDAQEYHRFVRSYLAGWPKGSNPQSARKVEVPETDQVADGYRVGDRVFKTEKDAEDYRQFLESYLAQWKK